MATVPWVSGRLSTFSADTDRSRSRVARFKPNLFRYADLSAGVLRRRAPRSRCRWMADLGAPTEKVPVNDQHPDRTHFARPKDWRGRPTLWVNGGAGLAQPGPLRASG